MYGHLIVSFSSTPIFCPPRRPTLLLRALQVPASFEPGHASLTAALAASAAERANSGDDNGSGGDGGGGIGQPPTPGGEFDMMSAKSLSGKVTTPCTPAEGGWSGNSAAGAGGGDKRSELRVSSADHRVQVRLWAVHINVFTSRVVVGALRCFV